MGATREDFSRAGRELPEARRAVLLKAGGNRILELPATPSAAGPVHVLFSLPSGGYATVFIDALLIA